MATKRVSTRTVVVSKALRKVDQETRREVRDKRLLTLEADNYALELTADVEEEYSDEEETTGNRKKKSRTKATTGSRTHRKIRDLDRIIDSQSHRSADENTYVSVCAQPSTIPPRQFCSVCGNWVPELNVSGKTRSAGEYVNAVVLIAMGQLAEDSIVDSAVASIRVLGGWKGDIYLITDRKECFEHIVTKHQVLISEVPPVDSLIKIKAMKTRLFEYLPHNVTNCLYLDVDILVTRSLDLFLGDLDQQIASFVATNQRYPDFGMFLDARGHFFGFCSGCDKWHTGIIWLRNPSKFSPTSPSTSSCIDEWRNVLLSGRYNTDQQSIDYAEAKGHCSHPLAFSSRHLLFAKDYFAAFLTPARTFVHLTAVSRMETQDPFYRYYVVPNIKSSLRPAGLNLQIYESEKKCSSSTFPLASSATGLGTKVGSGLGSRQKRTIKR